MAVTIIFWVALLFFMLIYVFFLCVRERFANNIVVNGELLIISLDRESQV